MATATFTVQGMTCEHCARAVTSEVSKIAGVTDVSVDVQLGRVTISGDRQVDAATVSEAVEEAGYEVIGS